MQSHVFYHQFINPNWYICRCQLVAWGPLPLPINIYIDILQHRVTTPLYMNPFFLEGPIEFMYENDHSALMIQKLKLFLLSFVINSTFGAFGRLPCIAKNITFYDKGFTQLLWTEQRIATPPSSQSALSASLSSALLNFHSLVPSQEHTSYLSRAPRAVVIYWMRRTSLPTASTVDEDLQLLTPQ